MSAIGRAIGRAMGSGVGRVNARPWLGGTPFPLSLFTGGKQGAWYDPSDLTTLYQDAAGTTPVAVATDPVGLIQDKSGNSLDASQATASMQGLYQETPSRIVLDSVDDDYTVTVPTGGWTGSMVIGTQEMTAAVDIAVPEGSYNLFNGGAYIPGPKLIGLIVRDGVMTVTERSNAMEYLQGKGSATGRAGNAIGYFRDRKDITAIHDVGDTSLITNFNTFVYSCSSLTTLDVSNWDTSACTTFNSFAAYCTSLTTLDVSNWDTSACTAFNGFAAYCTSLTTLDVSNWDTSACTTFNSFAAYCTSLTTLDVSNWDTSACTAFNGFVYGCSSLTTLDVSNWDTSACTTFNSFVYGCSSLTTLDVSNWDTSACTAFNGFAAHCTSLTTLDVSNWDTSACTNFGVFVYGCSSLTTLDVSNWDTSACTAFNGFAAHCTSLTTITVTGGTGNPLADSPCTNYANAFLNCALDQQSVDDILVAINAAGTSNGTLGINGGTNATPSTTGQAAADALRARGWTVTLNGY